ncbi:LabA-like NYN domain-containing protein [Salinibius halmophilus]|uniref:LabA-like NYN domain-containing protein n=1 Tax=Salinibius halmophilus TaxID=1853216 RepID=UPI000E661773|nr:NYN domain-containing protein [Salinibius halmophilus]
MKKAALFVDVQNIYYTCRDQFAGQFNYQALWQQVSGDNQIVYATAYAIDRGDSKQRGFQNALASIGFHVKLKPFIQRADGSAKGDWDVGLTIDVLEQAPNVDHIILLSGDGDFALLMNKVRETHGCQTTAYGAPGLTAKALIDSVDHFCQIDQTLLMPKK